MTKISEQVISAFLDGKEKKVGNTSSTGNCLRLHGNLIAYVTPDNAICIRDGDYRSKTTKERLNALLLMIKQKDLERVGEYIFVKDKVWFLKYNNGAIMTFKNDMIVGVKQ